MADVEAVVRILTLKSPSEQLEVMRGIVKPRPYWGLNGYLSGVKIPTNFKPRSKTEFLVIAYYVEPKDCDAACDGWIRHRRNLDGHLNALMESANNLGWPVYVDPLKKDSANMSVHAISYEPGIRFMSVDLFNESKSLKHGFRYAGTELMDIVMVFPEILSVLEFLPIPAFGFKDEDECEAKIVLSLSGDATSGRRQIFNIERLSLFEGYYPIVRNLTESEY